RVKWIAKGTMNALMEYAWPGNIRELQNLIERAVIRSTGDRLEVPVWDMDQRVAAPKRQVTQAATLEETERAQILATLKETQGDLAGPHGAAGRLGINRSTLQFRMKKLGIERRPSEYELVSGGGAPEASVVERAAGIEPV